MNSDSMTDIYWNALVPGSRKHLAVRNKGQWVRLCQPDRPVNRAGVMRMRAKNVNCGKCINLAGGIPERER